MLGRTDKNPQLNIGEIPLVHFINQQHDLFQLSGKIKWESVEKDFARFYSQKGAPSIPMRIMVGLILLKKVYSYSDKSSIEQWIENPYWQHFCGEVYFQHKAPLHFSDFNHFKHRIGNEGEKMIEQLGGEIFGQSFARGITRSDKKRKATGSQYGIARIINRFANYLLRATT